MGMTIAMPKNRASENMTMNAVVALPADSIEGEPAAQAKDDEQNQAVQDVLAGERVRLFKFSLQFQIRNDAAGKRERADQRGEQHGTREKRP